MVHSIEWAVRPKFIIFNKQPREVCRKNSAEENMLIGASLLALNKFIALLFIGKKFVFIIQRAS